MKRPRPFQGSKEDSDRICTPAPSDPTLTITGRAAVAPGGEGALCRGTRPGLAGDSALPAEALVARGAGLREALPAGELLPVVPAACGGEEGAGSPGTRPWVPRGPPSMHEVWGLLCHAPHPAPLIPKENPGPSAGLEEGAPGRPGSLAGPGSGAVPSQERQQRPWRGWAQGAGAQGSGRQDTAPSRQRQRLQGSPGGEKRSWWRAGAAPGRGQPAGAGAAAGEGGQRGPRGPRGGERGRGGRCLPGHCGQQPPGGSAGSGQRSGGQRRARHCTLPLCGGRRGDTRLGEIPTPASPTATPLGSCRAHSPDSDTGGRGPRGAGSRLRWGTLSRRRRSLGRRQL